MLKLAFTPGLTFSRVGSADLTVVPTLEFSRATKIRAGLSPDEDRPPMSERHCQPSSDFQKGSQNSK